MLVTATVVGLLTGFLGVGGGFLVVPALVLALGLPMAYAAGTSLVVITITSRRRTGRPRRHRHPPGLGPGRAAHRCCRPRRLAGARLAARVDTRKLQAAFTVLLVLVAGYTAWQAVPALI